MLPIFFNLNGEMMKNIKIILLLFIIPAISLSQNCDIKIPLELTTNRGIKFDLIEIGLDENATDGLDEELGERDHYNYPPGDELHAFVSYYDEDLEENIISYKDYRRIPDNKTFYYRYILRVRFPENDTLIIGWDKFGDCIDSAKIMDPFDINSVNMSEENELRNPNSSIDEFYIDIWFNKSVTSVIEENHRKKINVYPNPSSNIVNVDIQNVLEIRVFNALGNEMLKSNNSSLDISGLPKGLYFLKIIDIHGKQYLEKFVKVQN
jgi:hypothetical protein